MLALSQVSTYPHFSVPHLSTDEGHTWQKLNLDLHNTIRVLETLNDGKMGLLAGTEGQGLYYRSENSKWISANKGFLDANVRDVLSASDNLTYAIVSGVNCCSMIPFLFRREKSGNWTNLSFGYPPGLNEASNFTGFAVNPQNGENLILIVNSTLFVSNNRGSSWTRYPPNGLSYPVFDPADPNVVYFAKENREYRSTNGGKTVNPLPLKFNSTYHPLVVDPYNRNNLFFLDEETLYKSSDGGLTIRKITNGIHSSRSADFCLRDLVPLLQPKAFAMLSCTGYAYRSLDSGEHWTTIGDHLGFGQRIFAGVDQDNIYVLADRLVETRDGGDSWHNLSQELGKEFSGRPPLAFVTGMANSRTHPILVSTTSGIFQEAQRDK